MLAAFEAPVQLVSNKKYETVDRCEEVPMVSIQNKFCKFEARVRFGEGTRSFGVRVNENLETGESYDFRFLVGENRLVFDRTPIIPSDMNSKGLERPIQLEAGKEYLMQVIVDDDIATIYMDGVALNTRMYHTTGNTISLYVTDGSLEVLEANISNNLKD